MDDFDHGLDETGKPADSPESDEVHLTMEDNCEDSGTVALTLDANGQYQFRADTGQGSVTYRVVQVAPNDDNQPQIVAGLSHGQAVLHGLIGSSASSEEQAQARFAYIPAALSSSLETGQGLETRSAATTTINPTNQFYVMMTPQDVLQTSQRNIVPRSIPSVKADNSIRGSRDDRRRSTHNEVERRRRDKINSWIMQLGKLVPDCAAEQSKQGDSKGGILAKACEYIQELQNENKELEQNVHMLEQAKVDVDLLRQQHEHLKRENELLRAHLQQNGIEVTDAAAPTL